MNTCETSIKSYRVEEVIPGIYPSEMGPSVPYVSLQMTSCEDGYSPERIDLTPNEIKEKLGIRWGFSGARGVKRRLEGSVIEIKTVTTLVS